MRADDLSGERLGDERLTRQHDPVRDPGHVRPPVGALLGRVLGEEHGEAEGAGHLHVQVTGTQNRNGTSIFDRSLYSAYTPGNRCSMSRSSRSALNTMQATAPAQGSAASGWTSAVPIIIASRPV